MKKILACFALATLSMTMTSPVGAIPLVMVQLQPTELQIGVEYLLIPPSGDPLRGIFCSKDGNHYLFDTGGRTSDGCSPSLGIELGGSSGWQIRRVY
jgi:hypothetical protein